MKILVVEDDSRISGFLQKGLREQGYEVQIAYDGYQGKKMIPADTWDLFILDIMLPDTDGWKLVEVIRQAGIDTPVLMLSALGQIQDKVRALDNGADDYLVKPFHFTELLSRIRALRRRYELQYQKDQVMQCGDLIVNVNANIVERGGKEIILSAKEFKLIVLLLKNKDSVVSKTHILETVWESNLEPGSGVVEVYISYVRAKVDKGYSSKLVKTVKGRGYMLTDR